MKSPSLNLDDPSTWSDELRKLVYTDQTWAILINDYNGSCEKFQELDFSPESLADPIVCSLRNQCEEIIRRQYETFSVFHASRTEHPNDYLKLGILTSSEERLTAQARELFNGIPNLDEAFSNCSAYFQAYEGSVSLYTTRYVSTCYLSYSHYLTMVAGKLGPEAQARLDQKNQAGESVFIKCHLPISWLDDRSIVRDPSIWHLSSSLLRKLIVTKAEGKENYADTPSALVVFCPVPPDNVISIISVEPITN